MNITPVVLAGPIGAIVIMGLCAWFKEMGRRRAHADDREALALALGAKPPTGGVAICTLGAPASVADHSGRLILILGGDFGGNRGADLLQVLDRSGMQGTVGSILAILADRRSRERFESRVPPVFADRLVIADDFPGLAGGLGNMDPDTVMALKNRWGPTVTRRAEEVCDLHPRLHQGDEPALALVFIGQGGSALLPTAALPVITHTFKLVKTYGFTSLPIDDLLRLRVEHVLDEYRKVGVKGFVASDNLAEAGPLRNDFGMTGAVAGFATAAENADAPVDQTNAWYLLFERAPGHLVSYHTYVKGVPGFPVMPTHPNVPQRFFTYSKGLISAVDTALEEVRQSANHALGGHGVNGLVPLTSEFDIVLTAVAPQDLKAAEDEIVQGQLLGGHDSRNYHLLFAPVAVEIEPTKPVCPVAVVSLHALKDGRQTVQELTSPPGLAQLAAERHKEDLA